MINGLAGSDIVCGSAAHEAQENDLVRAAQTMSRCHRQFRLIGQNSY
jgi:hypothetical protein